MADSGFKATAREVYPAIGRCIYCGSGGGVDGLRTEHIIPEGLGGRFELPAASCRKCERITSGVERRVIRAIYGDARAHLNIRRKKKKKYPDKFSVRRQTESGSENIEVPIEDHPGAIPLLTLKNPAGFLRGVKPSEDWGKADLAIWSPTPNMWERVNKIGPRVTLTQGIHLNELGRFLAKIAYSYAVGHVGIDGVKSDLPQLILSETPKNLPYYVGAATLPDWGSDANLLHRLQMVEAKLRGHSRHVLIVTMRLFAPYGFPAYEIVVGQTD